MLRAVFEAVAAEVAEAGPDAVVEGARVAMRLRPEQLEELTARMRELIAPYATAEDYFTSSAADGDPYAMLLLLHRRLPPHRIRPQDQGA
jgi:hypothetical protein